MKNLLFTLSLAGFLFIGCKPLQQLPSANQKVLEYTKSVIGKKVDRGECWDLANRALEYAGASWDGAYKYGQLINHKKTKALAGDIIQFSNVKVKYKKGNSTFVESYPHHTAIITESLGNNSYKIAHQNNGFSGKRVAITELNFDNIIKGSIKVYRPVTN